MRRNMSKREIKAREKDKKDAQELISALQKIVKLGKVIDVKKIEKLLERLKAEETLRELRGYYP